MHTSIRVPQAVRIVLLVALISLLYSYFTDSNANNPRRNKNFRRPKFKSNNSPIPAPHDSKMASQYLKNIAVRRSIYALSKESTIPNSRIQEILTEVLLHTPSSFNNQAGRAVLLVGDQHDKLWNLATAHIKDNVPNAFDGLKGKLEGYKAGYGTVMFFEDNAVLEGLKAKNPGMPFDDWSKHSQGMLHIHTWDALELEGLGGNLQHYNMFPDLVTTIHKVWNLPESWQLHAQLVFGKPVGGAKEKSQTAIEQRLRVFGA